MIRFHQKFDVAPKLSLSMQLGGLNIIEKYNLMSTTTWKRELYLNALYSWCYGNLLASTKGVLRNLY